MGWCEPTGNLDSQRGQDVAMILHELAKEQGRAVIIVTHDPRIEEIADRILWLEDGGLRDRKAEKHDWARCPVCAMRVDRWTAVHKLTDSAGEQVFCSSRCRQRYED
jgi:putative ABC transport system ATP-binding protein